MCVWLRRLHIHDFTMLIFLLGQPKIVPCFSGFIWHTHLSSCSFLLTKWWPESSLLNKAYKLRHTKVWPELRTTALKAVDKLALISTLDVVRTLIFLSVLFNESSICPGWIPFISLGITIYKWQDCWEHVTTDEFSQFQSRRRDGEHVI